jgi:hypothetical protein
LCLNCDTHEVFSNLIVSSILVMFLPITGTKYLNIAF